METLQNDNWIKWVHFGIPDEEGAERDKKRKQLAIQNHCLRCTALSGCYFPFDNKPIYPLHPHCDCEIPGIAKPISEASSYSDIRKFTEYLFTDRSKGKQQLFENWGFKESDCAYLKGEYENQALEKYLSGDFILNLLDDKGQRITITITLPTDTQGDKIFKSGWMVHTLGKITLITPFSGEVKSK